MKVAIGPLFLQKCTVTTNQVSGTEVQTLETHGPVSDVSSQTQSTKGPKRIMRYGYGLILAMNNGS